MYRLRFPVRRHHHLSAPFSPPEKYHIENREGNPEYKIHMLLTVRYLEPQDFGTYRCVAKNPRGETDGTIKIYGTVEIVFLVALPSLPLCLLLIQGHGLILTVFDEQLKEIQNISFDLRPTNSSILKTNATVKLTMWFLEDTHGRMINC